VNIVSFILFGAFLVFWHSGNLYAGKIPLPPLPEPEPSPDGVFYKKYFYCEGKQLLVLLSRKNYPSDVEYRLVIKENKILVDTYFTMDGEYEVSCYHKKLLVRVAKSVIEKEETHFSDHKYKIEYYSLSNNKIIKKIKITKRKFPSLDTGKDFFSDKSGRKCMIGCIFPF
jgi:hypothetical protein